MSLLSQARADAAAIVGSSTDFGVAVTVRAPDESVSTLTAQFADIGAVIDPETGLPVAVRSASVTFELAALLSAFASSPEGVTDEAGKPWRVECAGSDGVTHTWKVARSMPDRALGVVACQLELYDAA